MSRRFSILAFFSVCAVVVASSITRAVDWLIGLMPVEAPRFAFAGDFVPAQASHSYADPMVQRHEAGTSRRAAARGI